MCGYVRICADMCGYVRVLGKTEGREKLSRKRDRQASKLQMVRKVAGSPLLGFLWEAGWQSKRISNDKPGKPETVTVNPTRNFVFFRYYAVFWQRDLVGGKRNVRALRQQRPTGLGLQSPLFGIIRLFMGGGVGGTWSKTDAVRFRSVSLGFARFFGRGGWLWMALLGLPIWKSGKTLRTGMMPSIRRNACNFGRGKRSKEEDN